MPERAIIPLMPAVALGFICGLIASVLLMKDLQTFLVGLAGAVIVLIAGASSVFGVPGERGEKAAVGGLRAATAIALFLSVFLFMLGFLRDGSIIKGLIWLIVAGVFAALLTRLRVRDRGEAGGREEQTA